MIDSDLIATRFDPGFSIDATMFASPNEGRYS